MGLFGRLVELIEAETPVTRVVVLAPDRWAGTAALIQEDGRVWGEVVPEELAPAITTDALALLRQERAETRVYEVRGQAVHVFYEVFPSPPQLIVVGASHAAVPLTRMARILGFQTVVVDARAAFADPARFPDADRVLKGWPQDVFPSLRLDGNTYVVLLSHDPKFDQPTLAQVLPSQVRYIGAIGSRKTQAERRARLRAEAYTEAQLARLYGPVGLDLGGRGAEETALAIMAEVVAVRRGGTGRPLRDRGHGA